MPGHCQAVSGDIRESDWRYFREVRGTLLERFSQETLDQMVEIARAGEGSPHVRYLRIFEFIQKRDDLLADLFDNPRRSIAVLQILHMRTIGLMRDEEFAGFSEALRDRLNS